MQVARRGGLVADCAARKIPANRAFRFTRVFPPKWCRRKYTFVDTEPN